MNGEEMLQVFIFYPYCMELQGKATGPPAAPNYGEIFTAWIVMKDFRQ